MAGVKRVENRTWSTADVLRAAGIDPEQFADAPRGAILGTVELVDVGVLDDQTRLPGCQHDLARLLAYTDSPRCL